MKLQRVSPILFAVAIALLWAVAPPRAAAHCDTLSGPVVQDARTALEKSDVTPVLKWIKPEHEAEVRAAFAQSLRVHHQGGEAAELADRYFFETVVRLHRAGEGAGFTGLKSDPPSEAVEAADAALANGNADNVVNAISGTVTEGLRRRFAEVIKLRAHANDSVAAGREYVAAYVEFVHYVEGLHQMASGGAAHHEE